MIERLSPVNQRRLAVTLFACLLAAALLITAWPLWSLNATYENRIDRVQEQLHRLRLSTAEDDRHKPRLEQLRRAQLSDDHYLKSSTEAVAAAELQRIVKRIAASNGAQILSTQIVPSTVEADLIRVALKVRMRGGLTGIVRSIYGLETNSTFLFMNNVSIRHSAPVRSTTQPARDQFDAELELIAYMPGQ